MSKSNITPLVQNPQESIDRLQTLSQELQAKNSNVANNSLYYLNQTAIQNFILSFQELDGKEGTEENEEQVLDSRTQTKEILAQIELDFLHHLQQEKEDIPLFKEEIITRNEEHKERLLSLRQEVKTRIEEYSGEISPVAPYQSKLTEGETPSPQTFKAQEIYKYSSEGIKNLTKDLIEESKTDLVNAGITLGEDIKYVISCFGSLARDEASPYSDLEFGVLLEDGIENKLSVEKLEEVKQYFRDLTDLLNIKVINLGETTATIQNIKAVKDLAFKLPTTNGFSFDGNALGGCKTPLGNKRAIVKRIEEINQDKVRNIEFINSNNSLSQKQKNERNTEISETINQRISKLQEDEYELIMTPIQMAQFHNEAWYRRDRHLSTVLYTTDILQASSLEGGHELLESYQNETNKILNRDLGIDELSDKEQERRAIELSQISIEDDVLPLTLRTRRAFALLDESVGKFKPKAGRDQEQGKSFSPKYDFYRPATMLIDHLSYLYDMGNKEGERSVWERFDKLFVGGSQRPTPLPLTTMDALNIEGINNLRWMIDRTLQIRLKNYIAKEDQNEDMILLDEYEEKEREELEKKGSGIYEREIFEVYYVMMPFYNDVNRFNESKGKNTKEFSKELYCDSSSFRKALIHNIFLHYEESIEYYEQAIKEYKENGQEKHPNVKASLHNLGTAYGAQGKYNRQIELLNQSLERHKEVFGEKHPDVATNLNNLGEGYGALGDHNRQIELLNQALEIRKEIFGEKHPNVAASLHNLGTAYGALGDHNRQIELLNQALEIRKEVFGEKHPDVAASLDNLGTAYGAFGDHKREIELLNQALEIKKEVFGKKHPSVAMSLNNLGNAYGSLGDHKRKIELLNQSLEIKKEVFGEKHPDVAGSLNNLGTAYGALGDHKRQIELVNQALEIRKEIFGERHPDVAASLNNLGNVYRALGAHKRAIELLNQALEIKKEFFGENHPDVAMSLNNLGTAYGALRDHNRQIELLNQALEIKKEFFDENHPDVAMSLNNLGTAYGALGDHKRQIELLNQALEIKKEFFGENHPDVAASLHNLGNAYGTLGDYNRQIELLNQALEINKAVFSEKHPDVAASLNNLGNAYESLGDHKRAIELLNQSLEIKKEFFDEEHLNVAESLYNLGTSYISLKDYPKAFKSFKKALGIFSGFYDENHPHVQMAERACSILKKIPSSSPSQGQSENVNGGNAQGRV